MQRKIGEEIPSDKRRRIGGERMVGQGRARAPFGAINNKSEANDGGTGTGAAEGSEPTIVDFTKEEVEALLNERMKKDTRLDTKVCLSFLWITEFYCCCCCCLRLFGFIFCVLFGRKKWSRWGILLRDLKTVLDGLRELKKGMFKKRKSFRQI
jgi:hypothetical protein